MTVQEFIKKYKVAKKYQDAIEAVETPAQGGEGYWVYLKDGWTNGTTGTHTIHEYTVKEMMAAIRTIEIDEEEMAEIEAAANEEEAAEEVEIPNREDFPSDDAFRMALYTDEALEDLFRRSRRTVKHIEFQLDSKHIGPSPAERPQWLEKRETAMKQMHLAYNEMQRRKK